MNSVLMNRYCRSTLQILISCLLVPFGVCEGEAKQPAAISSAAGCHNAFDPAAEQLLGVVLDEQIAKNSDLSADADLRLRLNRVVERLSATLDRPHLPFLAYVIESDEVNATGSPSGHLYLSSALTKAVVSDDELAFVVAHEMSHVLLHHPGLVATADLSASVGVERSASREELERIYGALFRSGGADSRPTRYRCVSEVATDAAALKLMNAAGYRIGASVNLWARLAIHNPVQGEEWSDDRLESLERLTSPEERTEVRHYGALRSAARFLTLTLLRPSL